MTLLSPGSVVASVSRAGVATKVLLVLLAAHLALTLALLHHGVQVPSTGDELTYLDGGKALSNLVRQLFGPGAVDGSSIDTNVVGDGWFMPGMSVVLTPLYLLDPHASLLILRLYLAGFNTLLFLGAVLVVRSRLGGRYACALAVFPGLLPMWVMMSFAGWGDLPAGLVAVMVLAHLVEVLRAARLGLAPSVRDGLLMGAGLIACLYLRSSSSPLVAAVLVLLGLGCVAFLGPRGLPRTALAGLAAAVVFVVLLLPWSVTASRALDDRVITTTTVPISLGITFGDQQLMCFGPCPGRNVWISSVQYSRAISAETGVSEVEVQRQMSSYALQGLTPTHYARQVISDMGRYAFSPTSFAARFRLSASDPLISVVVATSLAAYSLCFLVLGWALLAAPRRTAETQVVSIVLKVLVATLMVQPFLQVSHGRYWPVFAPLMGLGLGLAVTALRERVRTPATATTGRLVGGGGVVGRSGVQDPPLAYLTWVQYAGTATWVLIVLAVVVLSRL